MIWIVLAAIAVMACFTGPWGSAALWAWNSDSGDCFDGWGDSDCSSDDGNDSD